jgi:hypothetical protein
MRSPRERDRARRTWYGASAAALAAGTLLTAFSCATQETYDFSNGACVAGGCQATNPATVGSSSSSSSGVVCVDAGAVSFTTDIFNGMLDNGSTGCTSGGLCHGNDAGGAGGLVLLPMDPMDAYTALTASSLMTAPLPTAAGAKQYIVKGDPGNSGMPCNMDVAGGTNPFGQCGHGMPVTGTDLTVGQIDKIATWIACGAPNN